MSKVEERLSHLIADLEELKFQVKESVTLFEQNLKYSDDVGKVRSVEPDIITLQKNVSLRNLTSSLELYHHQIAIIKKASPSVAKQL